MVKSLLLILLAFCFSDSFSQRLLSSWSQQNIENYTKEMYDAAQRLTSSELVIKNITDKSWSGVFLTLNASINNHSKDTPYLRALAEQITNRTETKLEGTSRLIIWDRIITGEIIFEGRGLVFDNDLFQVGGRANQLLQTLTKKNFGFVTMHSTSEELEEIKSKWISLLANQDVEEARLPEFRNSKIPEISSLKAVQALIVSLQDNLKKEQITRNCLKKVYNLDEMPKERGSQASYCDPDTHTFSYLAMLFGDKKFDETKDAKWWLNFWVTNQDKLVWNSENGFYEVKQ